MTLASYPRPNCPRCRGTGVQTFTAKEYVGKTLVRTWTYESECPWCVGAQAFLRVVNWTVEAIAESGEAIGCTIKA